MKIDLPRLFFRWLLKNKKPSKKKINIDKIENILVMSNTAIGDTLFATPALRLIKERYSHIKITALLNPNNYRPPNNQYFGSLARLQQTGCLNNLN